jgi:hypothetical protein
MRRFAVLLMVAACSSGSGDDTGGDTGDTTGSTDGSSSVADGVSETGGSVCDMVDDCTSCWKCAKAGVCSAQYMACASSIECAGSLACIDFMCPPDDIPQDCLDHCCQNCEEHFTCGIVDMAVACIEEECAQHCGSAVCG